MQFFDGRYIYFVVFCLFISVLIFFGGFWFLIGKRRFFEQPRGNTVERSAFSQPRDLW